MAADCHSFCLVMDQITQLWSAFFCLYMAGVYCAFPLIIIWTSETIAFPNEKRAVAIALVNGIGDLAALSTDELNYKPGFTAMIDMCGARALIAAIMLIFAQSYD
jgi:hypothetical protein